MLKPVQHDIIALIAIWATSPKDETFARVSFYYSEESNKKGRGILRRGSS